MEQWETPHSYFPGNSLPLKKDTTLSTSRREQHLLPPLSTMHYQQPPSQAFHTPCSILPERRSCRRACAADFNQILPEKMCADLQEFIPRMLRKMKGIDLDSAIIFGPETRSSAPVRIIRDKTMQCRGVQGIYPIGEGAGYAGGIMSSAIDGIKAAEVFLS